MGDFAIDFSRASLDLSDPSQSHPAMLRSALNVIPTGGVLRTAPGFACQSNLVYAGGTSGKVAVWLRKFDKSGPNAAMLIATKQSQTAGTATATVAGYLVDGTLSPFTPAHVGRVVKNTTDSVYTTIVGFVNQWTVELADDVFESGEGYAILEPGETVAGVWYGAAGLDLPDDLTVLGEIDDTDHIAPISIKGRLVLLSGENRGHVLHGETFRPMGMAGCVDNNSLSVDVTQSGAHTGKFKFKLCWYDEQTYRVSPGLLIEDPDTDDGYFDLAGKKIVLNVATLPTNTVDTWTHYRLYVKKDEWADFYYGAEILKAAGSFEESESDATLLAREPLVENRVAPSGFTQGIEWDDRLVVWLHHGLTMTGGVSVTNGSDLVTLGGGYTTAEWMRGARLFMAASGGDLLRGVDVAEIVNSTTLQLVSEWEDATISAGDGRLVPYPSRLVFCLQTYADCEFSTPWHVLDVNPDDGDMIVACFTHGGDLYALKRRSLWRISKGEMADAVGGEFPTVILHTTIVDPGTGCAGPDAIAYDGRGTVYWLAGHTGLVMFDGMRVMPVQSQADVTPYWLQQTETELFNVRIHANTMWGCLEIHGLTRPSDGGECGLRYYWSDE